MILGLHSSVFISQVSVHQPAVQHLNVHNHRWNQRRGLSAAIYSQGTLRSVFQKKLFDTTFSNHHPEQKAFLSELALLNTARVQLSSNQTLIDIWP